MCRTAHGEQCGVAAVPPNRTHRNVTGNMFTFERAAVRDVLSRERLIKVAFSVGRSCRTLRALWCGQPAIKRQRSCWSWTRRALWTP